MNSYDDVPAVREGSTFRDPPPERRPFFDPSPYASLAIGVTLAIACIVVAWLLGSGR